MNSQMMTMSAMLAASIEIASELGAELTRLNGSLDWTNTMRRRLETIVRNGFPQETATPDDETRFYEAGHAAIELVMAGIREKAENDGLAGHTRDNPPEPDR